MRFDTSLARGVVGRLGRGSSGSPRGSPPPVSMQRADPIHSTVHRASPPGFIPLRRYRLSRAPSRSPLPAPFRGGRPARVSALFATPPGSVHRPRGIPSLASFRPQAFSASRRFAPLPGSGACFIPEPRPGRAPVQGLLSPRSAPASSAGAAPLPLTRPVLGGSRDPSSTPIAPRLRGVDPRGGACSSLR